MPSPTPELLESLHLLGPSQREMITSEIRAAEMALHGRPMFAEGEEMRGVDMRTWQGRNFTPPDAGVIREQLRRDKETLDRGTPPEFNGYQKNKIYQQMKADAAFIQDGMLPVEEMNKDTYTNVDQFVKHQSWTRAAQTRYLAARRILYPDDEGVSVEALRPHAGGVKSRKPWEAGYEKITWSEEDEIQDARANLDDSTYMAFLQLRIQGVATAKLIQQELGISKATYEACLQRLNEAKPSVVEEDPPSPAPKAPAAPKPQPTVAEDAAKLAAYLAKYGRDRTAHQLAFHLKMTIARVRAAQDHLAAMDGSMALTG